MVPTEEQLVPRANVPILAKINQPRLEAKLMDGYYSIVWAYIYNRFVSAFGVETAMPVWYVPAARAT